MEEKEALQFIKKNINTEKVILGEQEVLKALREGTLSTVVLAKNCKEDTKEDIKSLCAAGNAEQIMLEKKNNELGEFCKKPFSIAVIGFLA